MSLSDELTRLHDLHRSGALSDEEYAAAKARVIAAGGAAARGSASPGAGPGASGASAPGTDAASAVQAVNALRRPRGDRWVGGVCAGLALATGLEAWVWRLLFVVLALWGGAGLVVYALLWIFVPSE